LHGTLDIAQIATRLDAGTAGADVVATDAVRGVSLAAVALMSTGLLAKTALMPLHLWLPPAHGGAPAPASAVLSALVVKGSFFLLFRLWLDLVPGLPDLGRAGVSSAAAVADAMRGALTAGGFWGSAGPVLAVALTVGLFHVAGESAWQRRVAALGRGLAAFDGVLREWRVAGTLLLLILLLQGLAVLA
jgi:hypothetical protein